MKVLLTGASGMVGGEVLSQCLSHPSISSIVAFGRRELSLPDETPKVQKLQSVVIKDFSKWPEDILHAHSDAVGMIWCMGSYNGSHTADFEYPLAFQESMVRVLETKPSRAPFRYIHLSGKFVRQNQDEPLWFMDGPRKLKGLLETKSLSLAESHPAVWKTFILRPGGIVAKTLTGGGGFNAFTKMGAILGENWAVRIEELAAFMAGVAVDGEGEDSLIENARIGLLEFRNIYLV
ncbi:hypothetical protein FDECE_17705 [Fusarium decemcellulare]|nr:hypothetical protein FDECE_17705 [Fusarium decemcellulare]